jgi:hypothetical protein
VSRLIVFIELKLQDPGSTRPFARVAVVGPIALLEVALGPKCNHLSALLQVVDVADLLLPEVLLQIFLLASEHRLTQQLLTLCILTTSVLLTSYFPQPFFRIMMFEYKATSPKL